MSGNRLSRIEKSLRKSFSAVKRDIEEIKELQRLEDKGIMALVGDSHKKLSREFSKKISHFEKNSIRKERFNLLERRLDEIE